MQDSAQNNWKQRLENAEGFSGEILKAKNEAWEKLYARLHKKPVRKFMPWYWAAACLVAISITTIVFFNSKKHQPSVTISPSTGQVPVIVKKSLEGEQKKNEASVPLMSPEQTDHKMLTQKNNAFNQNSFISNNDIVSDSAETQTETSTTSEPAVHFDSSTKEIITVAPVRKKLRVVHINDLGQPVEESTADNSFNQKNRFPLRILNSENYNPVSAKNASEGLILFKSKNASN